MLAGLALPPGPMPPRAGLRPLKAWRYVGVYGPDVMLCLALVRVGPARQSFWAIWDRSARTLCERTRLGAGGVTIAHGRGGVVDQGVEIAITFDEEPGVETVCPSAASYAWTRKQGGIPARGTVTVDGARREFAARAVIDDTAGYYARHTRWRWSAGVGTAEDGRPLAWNLVEGVNDPPAGSERTLWAAGEPTEVAPVSFAADLSRIRDGEPGGPGTAAGTDLRFAAEATREHNENRLLVRSRYRQPFGTFSGRVAGVRLAEGFGVMEDHDVHW